MSPNESRTTKQRNDSEKARFFQRRQFLALGAGVGASLLAGCSTETGPVDGDGTNTTTSASDGATDEGTFRLLISDQPVAIDDFDELNVSFDRARIFRDVGEGDDEEDETGSEEAEIEEEGETENETEEEETAIENETETDAENEAEVEAENETKTEAKNETESDESGEAGQQGFYILDLGGATVDLTQVVGEKAISVFDGELAAGRYTKIELYAASVEGVVDGQNVNVKIPSGKLQIVKPFEVVPGKELTFVFDINVVEKGQTGEYNLLPVISESGVAGEDVEVDEVGERGEDEDDEETTEAEEAETEDEETGEEETEGEETAEDESEENRNNGEEGPPDDSGGDS